MLSKFAPAKYWFSHRDIYNIDVYADQDNTSPIMTISRNETEIADAVLQRDFDMYKSSPEWAVGTAIDDVVDFSAVSRNSPQLLKDIYTQLLYGVLRLRAYQAIGNANKGEAIADKILAWLETTDFFTAPASTRYHESEVCGLVFHSLKVYNEAATLQTIPAFADCNVCKWALVALVHDWCKIGLYESYTRNVKNESTGQWEKVPAFKIADVKHNNTLGHGAASMFMISQFLRLSFEEALAIRWHMGTWNVCDSEFNDLQDSNENYPLVHMIQFADQLAITTYESARYAKERNK